MRSVLVVGQLALSVILLVGGTLFVRSLTTALNRDVGFDPRNRALLSVNVGLQGYAAERGRQFYDDVLSRVRALPDVVSASWAFPVPFDTYGRGIALYVEGLNTRSKDGVLAVESTTASEDFIPALGLRLLEGRSFALTDSVGAPLVMVVSQQMAQRFWPGKNAIGARARLGSASGPEVTVIGVVADAQFTAIGERSRARAYLPLRQRYRDWQTLVVHTQGNPPPIVPQIKSVVSGLDPALPTFGVTTLSEGLSSGFATSRTAASVAGFFGLLALLISAVGLYGVVAASVTERTRELGVRMALGSTPRSAVQFVMLRGARLGLLGLSIGLAGAFLVSRTLASLLYGLSPNDPVTFVSVIVTLAIVVLVATLIPALRAVKLDPMAALRTD
jgi:predicted permease